MNMKEGLYILYMILCTKFYITRQMNRLLPDKKVPIQIEGRNVLMIKGASYFG